MFDQDTLYARWLEGNLSKTEEKELKENGIWQELELITSTAQTFTLPTYNKEKAYEQLVAKRPTKTVQMNSRRQWLGIAAGVAAFVTAVLMWPSNMTTVKSSYVENVTHIAPDGSTIVLNDGSSIKYDKSKWTESRIIHLDGEASFQVEKGSTFRVETENGEITVLGTSFNVRSWGEQLTVECFEGKVSVKRGDHQSILSVSQAVNMTQNDKKEYSISNRNPEWLNGLSKFENEEVTEVLKEINRQYDFKVTYTGEKILFTGRFTHDDLNSALTQICKPLGLSYVIQKDKRIVIVTN